MRPINLTPENQRRRQGGAGRTGPLAFLVIGALVIALAGVVALVTTSNQVSERESEVESLHARTAVARVRADRLAPFASFNEVKQQRTRTVTELADNRFNWSRVLDELALLMPRWVVLSKIKGSSGQSGEGESESEGIGASVPGPVLTVTGCAKSQTRVAQMINALQRIGGVTRVGLTKSVLRFPAESGGGSSSGGEEETECLPGNYAFAAVAVFDGAPLPVGASEATAVEATGESEATAEPESSEPAESESSTGGEATTETTAGGTTTTTTETIPPES
jgi:Tfp pilus assembly protein PilN